MFVIKRTKDTLKFKYMCLDYRLHENQTMLKPLLDRASALFEIG